MLYDSSSFETCEPDAVQLLVKIGDARLVRHLQFWCRWRRRLGGGRLNNAGEDASHG